MKITQKEIAEIMKPLHKKYLDSGFISWGSFMRAGIRIAKKCSGELK